MFAILSVFLVFALADKAPLLGEKLSTAIAGQYIVRYKDDAPHSVFTQDLLRATRNSVLLRQYKHALKGYAAKLTLEQLEEVRNNPYVEAVEVDSVVHASADCTAPVAANSWGLTRITQHKKDLNDEYTAPNPSGKGVKVYVIDTGVYVDNEDFEGRATFGWKADPSWTNTDDNGHGTHVSSTIIGKKYGVAKAATLTGVRVLGPDGSGSISGVMGGIDWVISQFLSNGAKPTVINMSLGGGSSKMLNDICDEAFKAGIVVVVAAGNENQDACYTSPAGAKDVISVGSSDNTDKRSYFSNWGTCVDVFGPGSAITAAWIGSKTATNTISGTSMASPHVAGVATLFWSETPSASAAEIRERIINTSTPDVLSLGCSSSNKDCQSTPNKLVYTGCIDN